MSRFHINSLVRNRIKQCPEVRVKSKHQLSRFHFGSENPNLWTNEGIMFPPFSGFLSANLRIKCLSAFCWPNCIGFWSTKRGALRTVPATCYLRYPCYRDKNVPFEIIIIIMMITIMIISLNFIRLLRVVFSSQQRLNRPAVNAVQ